MIDELAQKVLHGVPLSDILVVDCHCHMGRWFNFNVPDHSPADMVRWMDRLGIDCCVASHHLCIGPDFREGNRLVFEAAERFQRRIYGYVGVNPNYQPEENIADLERYASHPSMKGVKLHPDMHAYPVDGERYAPIWEWVNAHGAVLISHTWKDSAFSRPETFGRLAEKYPNARIIMGHSASTFDHADVCIPLAKGHPNLFLDLTGSQMFLGVLERIVKRLGSEQVLFGTDLPFLDARPQIGYVTFANIGFEEKKRVLGLNAARLFALAAD